MAMAMLVGLKALVRCAGEDENGKEGVESSWAHEGRAGGTRVLCIQPWNRFVLPDRIRAGLPQYKIELAACRLLVPITHSHAV